MFLEYRKDLAGSFANVCLCVLSVLRGESRFRMTQPTNILNEITRQFPGDSFVAQPTADGVPTLWLPQGRVIDVLAFLKSQIDQPFGVLFDLTAIDERVRKNRAGLPPGDFTVVYQLLSYSRNADIRLKVALSGDSPTLPTATHIWPSADWYEREVFDMFGVRFDGHPCLRRILMPPWWAGHPLRKDYPARATEMPPFELSDETMRRQEESLRFKPEEWGLARYRQGEDTDYMFLNFGPHHPSTHGVYRVVLQLDGEEIVDCISDIGYHHRGAEKMGERQSWHTYIPYTDRVDYLSGVMNNFPYVLSVEKLAGIEVPDRAKVIRIMMSELFRIINHLVFYGTYAQDCGQMSTVFYIFTDRERALDLVQMVTGARMHPNWFRIGGVAQDLPEGWEQYFRDFLAYMPKRLNEYEQMILKNRIIRGRTQGVGILSRQQAIDWGVTGPNLRACGFDWDIRKRRPYGGYEQFDFDVPLGNRGDAYDRMRLRSEEMRQSLRIIAQCIDNMPPGDYTSRNKLATPPIKDRTMKDIETLIHHFLGVSWGPVIPPGEAAVPTEAAKGATSYYLVSDGSTNSYRTRIRTPSFPHLQTLPLMARGLMVADLVAILGSVDFVLGDVDR